MDEKQRMSALEMALENETNEREFYLRQAGRTRNALGKAMFLHMADDELEHYTRLKELHGKWSEQGRWPDAVALGVRGTAIREKMLELIDKAAGAPETDDDDMQALRTAAAFEAKGVEAYTALARGTSDAKEKAFFELLAGMEREHYLAVKDAQEYLEDPSAWFTKKERHGLDGG
ncbi:MAG TPA: ferritin family protein [Deltaproteobacteria bacterium]|nr:ferritin family protein [Deltaproteobacteria bacterium]